MPSLAGGNTELGGSKLKNGKGFLKPNFELGPSLGKIRSPGPPVSCHDSLLHMQLEAGLNRDLLLPAASCP